MSAAPELRGGRRDRAAERAWGVPELWRFASVGSTNDAARSLAERGAPAGTVVVADEQRAGRGRAGRSWASPAGLGAWLSVILRPARLPAPALLPLVVGLAAARALDRWLPPPGTGLKWPNDLYFGGRKLGGVLCEASWEGATPAYVIAGVGVNVLHRAEHFPAGLRQTAVSVRIASGAAPAPDAVAGAIVARVMDIASAPPLCLEGAWAEELGRRDVLAGAEVAVSGEGGGAALHGTALGVSPEGVLLLRTAAGTLRSVRNGTVRFAARETPPSLDAPQPVTPASP